MEYIDESKYSSNYHTRKRKCSKYGCDNFSISFTNDISYCDDCFYHIKYPDKISRLNFLEEYKNTDPTKFLQALKKERDRIIQLEETLETKDDEIVSLEEGQEHYYEYCEENEYLTDQNSQLQEQVDQLQGQLQEMEDHECQKRNEWNEEIR